MSPNNSSIVNINNTDFLSYWMKVYNDMEEAFHHRKPYDEALGSLNKLLGELKSNNNMYIINAVDNHRMTLLHHAVYFKNVPVIRGLLNSEADITIKDNNECNPFISFLLKKVNAPVSLTITQYFIEYIVYNYKRNIANNIFLEKLQKINDAKGKKSPLLWAVVKGKWPEAQHMAKHVPEWILMEDDKGTTAFHAAINESSAFLVQEFLKSGNIDLYREDKHGNSLLSYAKKKLGENNFLYLYIKAEADKQRPPFNRSLAGSEVIDLNVVESPSSLADNQQQRVETEVIASSKDEQEEELTIPSDSASDSEEEKADVEEYKALFKKANEKYQELNHRARRTLEQKIEEARSGKRQLQDENQELETQIAEVRSKRQALENMMSEGTQQPRRSPGFFQQSLLTSTSTFSQKALRIGTTDD